VVVVMMIVCRYFVGIWKVSSTSSLVSSPIPRALPSEC